MQNYSSDSRFIEFRPDDEANNTQRQPPTQTVIRQHIDHLITLREIELQNMQQSILERKRTVTHVAKATSSGIKKFLQSEKL